LAAEHWSVPEKSATMIHDTVCTPEDPQTPSTKAALGRLERHSVDVSSGAVTQISSPWSHAAEQTPSMKAALGRGTTLTHLLELWSKDPHLGAVQLNEAKTSYAMSEFHEAQNPF
jgi:hypothetical protein